MIYLGKLFWDDSEMSVQDCVLRWITSCVVVTLLICQMALPVRASPGTEVFQGFTHYISEQIGKDKEAFAQADTCTAWFL